MLSCNFIMTKHLIKKNDYNLLTLNNVDNTTV